jgi:putative transposase
VAKQLDAAVAAFHRRRLKDQYRVLFLDGVVLKRKTGAGALARPSWWRWGLRPDGKKEVIEFRLAAAESAAQWEQFLDLVRRGLTGKCCASTAARPARRLAHGLSGSAGAALLGAQDP